MPNISIYFRKNIAIPQDHGSWVFIFSPLLIGLVAGRNISAASMALIIAAIAAFLVRQPITMAIKAYSGRRPRTDLPAARFWMVIYGIIILLSIGELVMLGELPVLYLAVPAAPVFAWHLWLVSRREERKQAGIEILATGVLALAAPAAYWIGRGSYVVDGWLLWLLCWLQSSASIVYAYLRLEQREWQTAPNGTEKVKAGRRALLYTWINLLVCFGLGMAKIIPTLVWLAFLVQALEAVWGTFKPAIGTRPVAVGLRQLFVSILFTVIFVIFWR
jgi:hypothetical protein